MKPRFFFLTVSLVAVLVASACASAVTSTPTIPPSVAPLTATATLTSTTPAASAANVTVQEVATSRGPNLEATDPSTVSLASGQLQLVEFFRFT